MNRLEGRTQLGDARMPRRLAIESLLTIVEAAYRHVFAIYCLVDNHVVNNIDSVDKYGRGAKRGCGICIYVGITVAEIIYDLAKLLGITVGIDENKSLCPLDGYVNPLKNANTQSGHSVDTGRRQQNAIAASDDRYDTMLVNIRWFLDANTELMLFLHPMLKNKTHPYAEMPRSSSDFKGKSSND